MSFYLDTSVLVRALTREEGSDAILRWMLAHRNESIAVSDWVVTEFSSALSLKVRTRQLTAQSRSDTADAFRERAGVQFALWAVHRTDFTRAAQLGDRSELRLRGSDALHLAIALGRGAALVTSDRVLADATEAAGCPVQRF